MKHILLLCLLVLGCNTPPPAYGRDNWQGTFRVSDAFTPAKIESIISAAEEWRQATGGRVEYQIEIVPASELVKFQAWSITQYETEGSKTLATTGFTDIHVRPSVSEGKMKAVMVHEMGHVAGLDHINIKGATMYEWVGPDYVDSYALEALEEVP